MPRRIALSIALALTVITTFSIIVVGSRTGLFGGENKADTEQQFAALPPATTTPQPPPTQAPQQAYAASDPIYVTEYVYVDEPAAVVNQSGRPAAGAAAPTTVPKESENAPPEEQPTTAPAMQPTPPPAVAPTVPGAATTVPPPVGPTIAPPPAPRPAQPPASSPGPTELEFTGTVTTISGSMVTFSHGGSSTIVKVTDDLNRLHAGSRVKVHAIWVASGYYVAKEIEFGEGD